MKKFLFSTMMASLLVLTGCQNDELMNVDQTGGEKVILTANIQGAAQTRVSLTAGTDENQKPIVKVKWNESGETFEVYGTSGSSTFIQIPGTNQFEGTLPESATGQYEVFYGNFNSLDEQDGKLGQSTANDSPVLMSAMFDSSSPSITFEHVTAILKPTFKVDGTDIDNSITKIVMGDVVYPLDGTPEYRKITIAPTSPAITLADVIYIHLPILLDYTGETFTFDVTAGSKEYTGSLTIPADMSIEAGKLYTATIALTEVPGVNYVWTNDIEASASVAGEGTEASPYLIQSANDLQWMINQVKNAALTPGAIDDDESSTPQIPYYRLTCDLEIDSEEGATWKPIGTKASPFVGYFDGGGHTISGEMYVESTNLIGFFGYNAGTISNLKNAAEVRDCRTLMPVSIEYSAIGSIAGYNTGKIIHCENSGNITTPSVFTTTYTGGICGYQYEDKAGVYAFISECKNSGNVTGVKGDGNASGGIVGKSYEGEEWEYACVIASENTGSVINGQYMGGICGYTNSTLIIACRNLGEFAGKTVNSYVGGIAGYNNETFTFIQGCYTTTADVDVAGHVAEDYVIAASYIFNEDYKFTEWVDDVIGPWDNPDYFDSEDEMNYSIVQYNGWLGGWLGCPCNWHWEPGVDNKLPVLVAGAPLGRIGG